MKTLTSLKQFIHTLVLTELEQYVHIFTILEKMLKVAHILVLNTSVYLNLTHELLFGSTLSQTRLLNNLRSVNKRCLGINEFVTFCKSSLAEELAFDISSDANLAAG